MHKEAFIWETHGIHAGTGRDHIKHGINEVDKLVEEAIKRGYPSITFIIHTPRLTTFRYQSERSTDVKFIRGDASYFNYTGKMEALKNEYGKRIEIRYGIELDWLGSGLGIEWSRAKLFQAHGVDYVIGSVHFSGEGIPYDGSAADTAMLIEKRGGLEEFWSEYLNELIEMVNSTRGMIQIVGHLDLPKIFAPLPEAFNNLEDSSHYLARRVTTLLEMIADLNLSIDLNLSGISKGCGAYPELSILKKACSLGIPVAIGTDSHDLDELGRDYAAGLEIAVKAGYRYYVSFSRGIPEKRPLKSGEPAHFQLLNLAIEMLNRRFEKSGQTKIPRYSFGGKLSDLKDVFPQAASLGAYDALRVRRGERSITINDRAPELRGSKGTCIFSHHTDSPGTLAVLFNTLASEGINVETAYLNSLQDGTATAFLTLSGPEARIKEAAEFVLGTAADRFLQITPKPSIELPPLEKAAAYLLEVDGIELPMPVSERMIITVHHNRPGVLLILLSALASRKVNVLDLQLGKRGGKGCAVLGVQGDDREISEALTSLGPEFLEASYLLLSSYQAL